jgi:hypothetical protein
MERKTFKDKKKANAFVKEMRQKGRFVHSMWSERDQTTTVLHGPGEPGPSEGTGIPPGKEGTAPPSIFEQKKRKRLGRSPGALGGKVVNRKKGKTVGKPKLQSKKIKPNVGMSATFPLKIDIGVTAKKHGGKITYKMTGGQVVDAGYD